MGMGVATGWAPGGEFCIPAFVYESVQSADESACLVLDFATGIDGM